MRTKPSLERQARWFVIAVAAVALVGAGCSAAQGNGPDGGAGDGGSGSGSGGSSGGGSGGSSGGGSGGGSGGSSGSGSGGGSGGSSGGGSGSSSGGNGDGGMGVKSNCAPAKVVLSAPVSVAIAANQNISRVAAADMNGDGKADLVAAEGGGGTGQIELFLGKGDGTFASGKATLGAFGENAGFTVGRFTGSGHVDVVFDSFDHDSVDYYADVLPNDGTGAFGAPISSTINWDNVFKLRAADVNGDGKQDILFTDQGTTGAGSGFAINMGGGSFTGGSGVMAGFSDEFVPADLNGDGAADIVDVGGTSGACVLLNTGSGGFPAMPTCYGAIPGDDQPDHIAVGDIDGDGKPDMILVDAGAEGPDTSVYLNKGNGTFGNAMPATLGSNISVEDLQLVDVNNDGKADIIAYNDGGTSGGGSVSVLIGNGDGSFAATPMTYPAGSGGNYDAMAIADFAGNGLRGIAVIDTSKNTVDVMNATCKP